MGKLDIKEKSIYIVMYHYVRRIKGSSYKRLKGLEYDDFKKQIDYFTKKYNVLDIDSFLEIITSSNFPTKPSILLTFDDGYMDHYKYVFPYLSKKNIAGFFYPPVKSIQQYEVLDVNKIHFILEKEKNTKKILNEMNISIKKNFNKNLNDFDIEQINLKSRFDDKETSLIKILLQDFLPLKIRKKILPKIFEKVCNRSENDFAKELYIGEKEVKEMNKNKMVFGCHGYNHLKWQYLSKSEQENEIQRSIEFYNKIGIATNEFTICYPYGSYNKDSLSLSKKYNISFCLTTNFGSVNINNSGDIYTMPRIDTNYFSSVIN